ncbi:hypothetical protein [Gracilimonas mengyeensis]|uniref:Uncharacterized protein n=1 Tax=Gracilimonas mengyeensis TaxID=1302730 RepID=A0A521ES31_9BACT|nr:hypothetical protein [Gracilimonas mengyeensis]SMO86733.1 hypothetical protein SAMN06265219_11385 [Gracilimonas mengyeensis]
MQLPKHWKRLFIELLVQFKQLKKRFRNWFQDVEVELYDLNKVAEPYVHYFNFLLVIMAMASIIASEGFQLPEPYLSWNWYLEFGILSGFILTYVLRLFLTSKRWSLIRSRKFESLLVVLLVLFGFLMLVDQHDVAIYLEDLFGLSRFMPVLVLLTKIYLIILIVIKTIRAAPIIISLKKKPTQLVAYSFVSVIIFGALLLMTPSSTVDGQGLNWIDALFTSTSAVCVTGLIVVDTATHLTFFGQMIVLILI